MLGLCFLVGIFLFWPCLAQLFCFVFLSSVPYPFFLRFHLFHFCTVFDFALALYRRFTSLFLTFFIFFPARVFFSRFVFYRFVSCRLVSSRVVSCRFSLRFFSLFLVFFRNIRNICQTQKADTRLPSLLFFLYVRASPMFLVVLLLFWKNA